MILNGPLRCYATVHIGELELLVDYNFTKGVPEQRYGDYPHPAEPADYEITKVVRADTGAIVTNIEPEILEYIMENEDPESDFESNYADYLYEQSRDE